MIVRWIPNGVSFMNLLMGFLAIERIGEGRYEEAFWLIALALIFDSLDGNIARIFHAQSQIGKEMDSLGDIVSFVVAPALLFLKCGPLLGPGLREAIVFFYLGAGTWRLAVFNLNVTPVVDGYFRGLPTPASAMFLSALLLSLRESGAGFRPAGAAFFWTWVVFLALLMISPVRYPKMSVARLQVWWKLAAAAFALFMLAYWKWNIYGAVTVPFGCFVFFGLLTRRRQGLEEPKLQSTGAPDAG